MFQTFDIYVSVDKYLPFVTILERILKITSVLSLGLEECQRVARYYR